MFRTSILCLSTALVSFCVLPALAQVSEQVTMDTLQPAALYDAGTLDVGQGGLGPQLWQGTTSARAASLISNIKTEASPTTRALIRAVLLSGGTPPQAIGNIEAETYTRARLNALLDLNEISAFQSITDRSNLDTSATQYVKLFTEHALLNNQTATACQLADGVQVGRKSPYWAKLRAYCHFTRDELPAAELTADLVKRSDHEDAVFFNLFGNLTGSSIKIPKAEDLQTPLHIAMAETVFNNGKTKVETLPPHLARQWAMNAELDADVRLQALKRSAPLLSADEIGQILESFSDIPSEDIPALLAADKPWTASEWGQAYMALRSSTDMVVNTTICAQMLTRAEAAGILPAITALLAVDISILPHGLQASENPSLFARLAVQNRDIGALQSLFQELDADNPLRGRIALAADALGNGFMLTDLGVDIEARLSAKGADQVRAVRDTYLAVSLGANLSDTALNALLDVEKLDGHAASPAALLALKDASRRRAQAETVLRAAEIIGTYDVSDLRIDTLASILTAFGDTSLNAQAGQLAALDFLHGY